MKKPLTISFLIFIFAFLAAFSPGKMIAQENIQVIEQDKSFSRGTFPAFTMEIPQANWKRVSSDWKNYLRQQSKKRITEKNGEIILPKCVIPILGADSLTVYSLVITQQERIILQAIYFIDDSIPINSKSYAEKNGSINVFMREFGVNEYRLAVEKELEESLKIQKNRENAVIRLETENESLLKEINEKDRYNTRKRDDISTNDQEQKMKSDAILQQKTMLMNFSGTSEMREKEEKRLRSLEKDKKDLQKENESMHRKIEDKEQENRISQKKIDTNKEDAIPAAKAALNAQKNVVAQIQDKLSKIK